MNWIDQQKDDVMLYGILSVQVFKPTLFKKGLSL